MVSAVSPISVIAVSSSGGRRKSAPNSARHNCAISRARPRIEKQSARFGVKSISIMVSFRRKYSRISIPTGASSGKINSPACSSLSPSSRAEHNIPNDSTPRSLDFLIRKSPGNTAPMVANGTLTPTATLGAPQTICSGSPVPLSTVATRSLSASGCGFSANTFATTTLEKGGAAAIILSTSNPAMVRRSASNCGGRSMP